MKKRFMMILAVMLICMMTAPVVYGGQLTVESIYPGTDETGLQTVNQMARIVFSGEIDVKANEEYFKILDPDGKKLGIMVLEQPDDPNRVNLVLEKDLQESTEYTIVIDKALTDTAGNELGEEYRSSFTTRSQKKDSLVTTVMMFLMFGAVIVLTIRDQNKQQREAEEEEAKSGKAKKVNPYKEAKKGGSGKKSSSARKKESTPGNTRQRANQIQAERKKKRREKVDQIMKENQKKQNQKKK